MGTPGVVVHVLHGVESVDGRRASQSLNAGRNMLCMTMFVLVEIVLPLYPIPPFAIYKDLFKKNNKNKFQGTTPPLGNGITMTAMSSGFFLHATAFCSKVFATVRAMSA